MRIGVKTMAQQRSPDKGKKVKGDQVDHNDVSE